MAIILAYFALKKGFSMKKIFLSLALGLAISTNGAYLNGIAATVNNEPITDYDVELVVKRMNITPNEALNVLIRDKLELSQIKELGLGASESEINEELSQIAKQNGYSDLASYAQVLSHKAGALSQLREQAKENLARGKLYDFIISQPNDNITRENAMRFYEQNRGMFTRFSSAKVTRYTAKSGATLERVKVQGLASGVTTTAMTIYPNSADNRVLNLIAAANVGDFTPIVREGDSYVMYKVNSKENPQVVAFEEVEQNVAIMMAEQEKEALIADYFNKLRAKANIEIIKR